MTYVASKVENDCTVCAISMATGLSYEVVKKGLFKDDASKNGSNRYEMKDFLDEVGFSEPDVKQCNFNSVPFLLSGKKAVMVIHGKTGINHACYWDGYSFMDSLYGQNILFEDYKKYADSFDFLPIKTTFIEQVKSLIYSILPTFKPLPEHCTVTGDKREKPISLFRLIMSKDS